MIVFKERSYTLEKNCNSKRVENHPLENVKSMHLKNQVKHTVSNPVKTVYADPLSVVSPLDILSGDNLDDSLKLKLPSDIEPWSSKRLSILTTYTTSEKLSIISSFLISKPDEDVRILNKLTSNSIIDKVKSRLEQLDEYDEEVRETSNLSVSQFTDKMYELQNALKMSWNDGHRVKTLQIVIQSTKLLSESNVAQFFPSKFVLVTDLVDNFGAYVFDRLKSKSSYTPRGAQKAIPLPDNFRESQVPEAAKETARNWFYKVASIRELVARLYVEATLVQCYRFFDATHIGTTLTRLVSSARGIGDPLLATYARAYIVRVGIAVYPHKKDYIESAFDDTLFVLANSSSESQLRLFIPAVDWILACLCASATDSQLDAIVAKIERTRNPLLLHSALNSLSTAYIMKHTLQFAEMIDGLPEGGYPKFSMYKQLGACVSLNFTLGGDTALQLMRLVWKFMIKLSDQRQFIECADAWAEFLAMNFDKTHINRFVGHVAKEMKRDNAYHDLLGLLQSILGKIISYKCDFEVSTSVSSITIQSSNSLAYGLELRDGL